MTKICVACGMPMKEPEEFALGDTSRDYCVHCMREDGSMQSFDEKRAGLAAFIMKTQGFDEAAALPLAEAMMRKLPAWAGHFQA
ncbi:MAG: zinc ribbon domain-containing protein [Christensenellaceae bacterium]|nr:zinc ribbon domain-containing protein [Christensenellaceae bacterium]